MSIEYNCDRRTSEIWQHFEELNNNRQAARCCYCKEVFTGGVTNLRKHIVRKHKNVCMGQLRADPVNETENANELLSSERNEHDSEFGTSEDIFGYGEGNARVCKFCSLKIFPSPGNDRILEQHIENCSEFAVHHVSADSLPEQQKIYDPLFVNVYEDADENSSIDHQRSDSGNLKLSQEQEDHVMQTSEIPEEIPTTYNGRKRSIVWQYFQKFDNRNVQCKICSKFVAFCGSTTNLKKHLRIHGMVVARINSENGVNNLMGEVSEKSSITSCNNPEVLKQKRTAESKAFGALVETQMRLLNPSSRQQLKKIILEGILKCTEFSLH